VSAAPRVDLTGLSRIRWFKGSLIGVQQSAGGGFRAVRIRLERTGRAAAALEVLDDSLPTADPTAATVSGGVLYYLAKGDGTEMIVKKVPLR
jgi:hypothetical protein